MHIGPAFIAAAVIWEVGDAPGTLAFHSASAQIIPVLILALVFQGRAFDLGRSRVVVDGLYMFVSLMLLVVGEAVALMSVFTGEPEAGRIVAGALAVGLSAVAMRALFARPSGGAE